MTLTDRIYPDQTIGIIGGGQLGKMLAQSALRMGYKVAVLDPSADAPASATSHLFINAAFDDEQALKALGDASDVITYEFENIDGPLLKEMVDKYYVPQGQTHCLRCKTARTKKTPSEIPVQKSSRLKKLRTTKMLKHSQHRKIIRSSSRPQPAVMTAKDNTSSSRKRTSEKRTFHTAPRSLLPKSIWTLNVKCH